MEAGAGVYCDELSMSQAELAGKVQQGVTQAHSHARKDSSEMTTFLQFFFFFFFFFVGREREQVKKKKKQTEN